MIYKRNFFAREEKQQAIDESQPKEVDLSLPGWGSWTSSSIQSREARKPKRKRLNKRLLFRVPKAPPRKDANKGHVIINEEKNDKIKEHMVFFLSHLSCTCFIQHRSKSIGFFHRLTNYLSPLHR